jgi:hypothetical protein
LAVDDITARAHDNSNDGSTLSMLDLFSFDVSGGGRIRMNLETLFHKYEANVEIFTKSLLEKLALGSADIKTELIDLLAAKLLNFVRNPFPAYALSSAYRAWHIA